MSPRPGSVEHFGRGDKENPKFWGRLGGLPDLLGKLVVDLGCGHGSLGVGMAQAGVVKAIGADLYSDRIAFPWRSLRPTPLSRPACWTSGTVELTTFLSVT